jgi:hypothetical protein
MFIVLTWATEIKTSMGYSRAEKNYIMRGFTIYTLIKDY